MNDGPISFWDAVDAARDADGRYRREAYAFVMNALRLAVMRLPEARREDPERRHLSGQELIEAAIEQARSEFGPMAGTVFREWGLRTGEDFGRIVFQLVDAGILSARPEDGMDDFRGYPDLPERLEVPLEPGLGPGRA